MNTLDELTKFLSEHFVLPPHLNAASTLQALKLDSLTLAELMFLVEDHFAIDLEGPDPLPQTLGDMVALIDLQRLRGARALRHAA